MSGHAYTAGDISIHALREESDYVRLIARACRSISIHALREESDRTQTAHLAGHRDFNPRSP